MPDKNKIIEVEDHSAELIDKMQEDAIESINKLYESGMSESYIHGALNAWSSVNNKPMTFEHDLNNQDYLSGFNHGIKTIGEMQERLSQELHAYNQKLN
jgi:hypothetical protein